MSPFQLYIGVSREAREFKSDISLSTADITYWLNKALDEFVDTRYSIIDSDEEARRDLDTIIQQSSALAAGVGAVIYDNTLGYTISKPTGLRYILSEKASITVASVLKTTNVKPISLDRLNFKLEDPFSEHNLSFGKATPLRYEIDGDIVLVGKDDYTINTYTVIYIETPDRFVILDAEDTTEYTIIPSKTHKELISIATRMILENESNPRYQTTTIEELKS